MKQKLIRALQVLWLLLFALPMGAQSNYSFQYWFNNDFASAQYMNFSASSNTFTELSIPAKNLPFGVNKINYRVSDSQNKYSSIGYSYFLKGFFGTNQPVLEYWFNNDFDSAAKYNYTAAKDSFTVLDIPATNVPYGVNKINFRFSDGIDKHSSIAYFYFMKGFLGAKQTIVEYWFDDNENQKNQIAVADSTVKLEFNAPIADLAIGIHTMHIRAGYTIGVFTAPQTAYFFKLSQGAQKGNIEYWFDDDIAHKVQYKIGTWENMVELNLDVSALASGTHKLSVRAGVDSGLLSPISSSYFFKGVNKYAIPVTNSKILNYRYWFDNDKLAMQTGTISDITQTITFLKEINANPLNNGKHNISIQFQNSYGMWSDVAYGEFEKIGNEYISVPQLMSDKTLYKTGDNILLTGYNFNKYGKLSIDYYCNGYLKSSVLYADKYGKVMFTIPTSQPGTYTFSATNLETNEKSPYLSAKVQSLATVQNNLKLNYPIGSNFKINLSQDIVIKWSDFIKLDYRYTINNKLSKRSYDYLIELYDENGTKLEEKTESGECNLESEITFTTKYTPTVAGKYRVKVTDVISGNNISTDLIGVVDNSGGIIVNTEWDYSINDANGKVMRDGNPLGVAADGTGRIYLTLESKGAKTIKEVTVSLSDEVGKLTGPEMLGRVMPATVINANSDEANAAIFDNTTSNNVIGNKVWFWYVAPDDFTKGDDIYASENTRTVTAKFEVTYTDNTIEDPIYKTIQVVRPAILLVHGLNGDNSCWQNFSLDNSTLIFNDTRFKIVKAINVYPDKSFYINAAGLLGINPKEQNSTFEYPICELRRKGYASNRVDYICHSMGGCILRYAVEKMSNIFYSNNTTYGNGFTNKVITIDTPHEGSSWGDMVGYIAKNPIFGSIISKYSKNNLTQFDFKSLSYQWSDAVRDLSIEEGVRFDDDSRIKAHLIGADMLKDIQNTTNLSPEQMDQLIKSFPYSNIFNNQILLNAILIATANENFWLWKRNIEINFIKDENEKKIASLIEIIERIVGRIPLEKKTDIFNIFIDGDGIVSRFSQFAGNLTLTDNKTIIENGYLTNPTTSENGVFHTQIVENQEVEKKVNSLLNSSIHSSFFGAIPGHTANKNSSMAKECKVQTDSLTNKIKFNINFDTTKVKIISPTTTCIVKADEKLEVKAGIMDTVSLKYVELQFQGKVYTDFSKERNLIFNVPVNGEYLNTQKMVLQATYYYKDSVSLAYDSILIEVSPAYSPLHFSAKDKVIFMNQGDTVSTSYEAIYPTSLYIFRTDPNLIVKIDNPNFVEYIPNEGTFTAKQKGNTFAEVSYAGLKDTIYFVLEETADVATTLPNTSDGVNSLSNQNFTVYPNPATLFTTVSSTYNIKQIELYDMSGRIIQIFTVNSTSYRVDLHKLSKGIYLIKAITEDGLKIGRFVKE